MNYAIPSIYNVSGIWNFHRRIQLPNTVYGLAHYLHFALYHAFAHYVFFEQIISIWKIHKATLHIINCVQYIL